MLTEEQITEIRERVSAATPGPWEVDMWGDFDKETIEVICGCAFKDGKITEDDVYFIVRARTDIPLLLDEITRLTDEVERLQTLYDVAAVERALNGKEVTMLTKRNNQLLADSVKARSEVSRLTKLLLNAGRCLRCSATTIVREQMIRECLECGTKIDLRKHGYEEPKL